jgi:hypothetical protein
MGHTITATDYDLLDTGTYGVEWKKIGDPEMGEFGRFIKIAFTICDATDWEIIYGANGDPFELVAQASYKLTKGSKLRDWCEATLGRPIEDGEEFDLDSLVGKRALAAIIQRQGNKGGTFNNIDSLTPLPKRRAGAESRKKPTAVTTEEDEEVPF